MIYATAEQFIEAFTEQEAVALTNSDDPSAEYVNATVLTRALTDASAEIDSYLTGNYDLPLTEAPSTLVVHCLNIARYRLSMVAPGEDVRKRYEDSLRFLSMIAKGTVKLGVDSNNEPIARTDLPKAITQPRQWTRESLRGWSGVQRRS